MAPLIIDSFYCDSVMGRSQVLYNRTKGRNRAGRGGRGDETGSAKPGRVAYKNQSNDPWKQEQRYQRTVDSSYGRNTEKDYEHEYEVLLAGRDTYLSKRKEDEEKDDIPLGASASVCIASMAATLESISVSSRLRMPLHVAASAFPSRYQSSPEKKHVAAERPSPGFNSNNNSPSNELEDWLDDACGVGEDAHAQEKDENVTRNKGAYPTGTNPSDATPTTSDEPEPNTNNNDGMRTEAVQATEGANDDGDDEGLDNWLDSIIE